MDIIPDFSSVETFENRKASAIFVPDSASVFREDGEISPVIINDKISYIPWGGDNNMPFNIIKLIEDDETLATCQQFNAEICYGAGLNYNVAGADTDTAKQVEEFMLDNDMAAYFHGCALDMKHFGLCFTIIILSNDAKRVNALYRKEACYCRFAPANHKGNIPYVLYANWRNCISSADEVEVIPLLDETFPFLDLKRRIESGDHTRKFVMVTRIPTADSTYYPIPYYAALFKSKWYNIKRLIATAKESKLKNSAPLKYQIEISAKYWVKLFETEGITDVRKRKERIALEKKNILDFLTGVENSGKALFSTFYVTPDGKTQKEIVITKIDNDKEGGDWATDIQEAVNMVCFTMRVHSNLVGSVPGKSQSNNSGSDKRELYTIAQALQTSYRDLLFGPHKLIIRYNGWKNVFPEVPFIQLTTLDEHVDAKKATTPNSNADDNQD